MGKSMPRVKLTKSVIDALPRPETDVVYWDAGRPGFGIKVTPKGRKVFIVLYRTGGAGSRLSGHAKLGTTALYTRIATNTIRAVMSPLEHLTLKPRTDEPPA